MAPRSYRKPVVAVALVLLATGSIPAEEIHFLPCELLPITWSIDPTHPTPADVIYFSGPLIGGRWRPQGYMNSCFAVLAAGAEPVLTIGSGFVRLEAGEPLPSGVVCPMWVSPVCGIGGQFGPLPPGDWVFECTYPIAPYCSIEFHVGPILSLLAPAGAEELVAGGSYFILWDSYGIGSHVHIDYSTNAGQDWIPVAGSPVPNTGSCEWTAPEVDSNQCQVRISDPNDSGLSDTSGNFTIFVCPGLTGDIDGDCYVDAVDYAFLAGQWADLPGTPPADIAPDPPDGFVDWLDLCALACDWLRCGNPFDAGCQD